MSSDLKSITNLLLFGILLWIAAGIAAFFLHLEMKIIWTSLTGAILGSAGIAYVIRRNRKNGL